MEKKNLIKTGGAIILIVVVIVAAFLYGNKQHQTEVRNNEQEQQKKTQTTAVSPQTASSIPQSSTNISLAVNPDQTQSSTSEPTTTPKTGSEIFYIIPSTLIFGLYGINHLKKKDLRTALIQNK